MLWNAGVQPTAYDLDPNRLSDETYCLASGPRRVG